MASKGKNGVKKAESRRKEKQQNGKSSLKKNSEGSC